MSMKKSVISLCAAVLCASWSQAQQVEYVTRTHVGHAVGFGSSPIRASIPKAYVTVNNGPHAIRFGSKPLSARLPREYVIVNNGVVTLRASQPNVSETPRVRTTGPRVERRANDRSADRQQDQGAGHNGSDQVRAPSRHMLRVMALMNNKLDCHQ